MPMFDPGISIRRIPSCRPPLCEGLREGQPEWYVNSRDTLDRTNWIKGWIAGQLFNRGAVDCEDSPMQKRSGGWWGDNFRAGDFRTGSLLWTLQWSRVNNETLTRAKAYAHEAIDYLLAWGIATRINIEAEYVSRRVMKLSVFVYGPGYSSELAISGQAMPDSTYLWKVEDSGPRVPRMEERRARDPWTWWWLPWR